mgnify:CR=1 FL=1
MFKLSSSGVAPLADQSLVLSVLRSFYRARGPTLRTALASNPLALRALRRTKD